MVRTTDRRYTSLIHRRPPGWLALRTMVALAACAFALTIKAQDQQAGSVLPQHWRFDAAGSRIGFDLAALGMFGIHGGFPRFEGESRSDPADGTWRIETRIDATSLEISPARYLAWARSSEFFDVLRHPDIRFTSDPAPESLLRDGGELTGRLRLRGIERPVRFEVAPAECEAGMRACTIRVSGEINRRQFGMDSRRMTLSNRVALSLHLRAEPAGQ